MAPGTGRRPGLRLSPRAYFQRAFAAVLAITRSLRQRLAHVALADRADLATEIIAKKIIELAQQGERDTVRIEPLSGESSTATAKI